MSSSLELAAFSSAELTAFLSQPFNAHVVNEERWYGMSHLHDVCVKGNLDQVKILVGFGADVNAANAGGETPTHLAARRGNVAVSEELRKSGADIHARDQSDRTALHFAALGGNPSSLSYFLFFCRLDPLAKDKNGQTFFHLLCQYKKVESVFFCLNAGIFSGAQIEDLRDATGKNPFDLSLENSTAEIPYLLLRKTAFSLLRPSTSTNDRDSASRPASINNNNDFDDDDVDGSLYVQNSSSPPPPDPARTISFKAKSNPSFAQLQSSIVFHRRVRRFFRRSDSLPLLGPIPAYTLSILKPILLPPLVFVFCRYLVGPSRTNYSGGLFYLLAFYFSWSYKSENYRLNHVSKWPNPFMAALFASGILHDIVVFYLALWPAMTTTTSTTTTDHAYGVFDIFVVVVTLTLGYQYFALIMKDPGRAPPCAWLTKDAPSSSSLESGEENSRGKGADAVVVASVFLDDYCPNCGVRGDASAHVRHCRLCDACMRGFDHHCLFLLTCVAKRNRRLFLSFLLFVDIFCIPTLLLSVSGHLSRKAATSHSSYSADDVVDDDGPLLRLFAFVSFSVSDCDSAALIFLCLGNWMAWLWIAYLIFNQLYYIGRCHTTSCPGMKACRDDLSRKLSWRQSVSNIFYFFANGEVRTRTSVLA